MLPDSQTTAMSYPPATHEATCVRSTALPDAETVVSRPTDVMVRISESPSEWTKKMEREFRSLALAEAQGRLTAEEDLRLNELNSLRDQLMNPLTSEEIRRQLRKDRLLARMWPGKD